MKRLAILGSTGSIGQSALSLVDLYPERLEVVALAARRSGRLLRKQIQRYRPRLVALYDSAAAESLRAALPDVHVLAGTEGLEAVACHPEADMVLSAVTGAAGLIPTYRAVEQGRDIALANKETMVMAGELLIPLARRSGASILPVDSEHSALHQCLRGSQPDEIQRLILTASGGPFLNHSREELAKVTVQEALDHPTWEMGRKITIDSATLMNKGLEVIEACRFFGVSADQVAVVVHPQSVIHSMVEFVDGTMLAQMSITDMRSSLLYAFGYPERWESRLPRLDLSTLPGLGFLPPDTQRFPCLDLAYSALRLGATYPTVLNAANEVAVEMFLEGKLDFVDIPDVIEKTLEEHSVLPATDLESILEADRSARQRAWALCVSR
ncbi:MAG: 1-deoxy-D-xylulose-5-phosphate reductoisomerase [Acidobacteriota bacterium]